MIGRVLCLSENNQRKCTFEICIELDGILNTDLLKTGNKSKQFSQNLQFKKLTSLVC